MVERITFNAVNYHVESNKRRLLLGRVEVGQEYMGSPHPVNPNQFQVKPSAEKEGDRLDPTSLGDLKRWAYLNKFGVRIEDSTKIPENGSPAETSNRSNDGPQKETSARGDS
jgi:hypothetical protein